MAATNKAVKSATASSVTWLPENTTAIIGPAEYGDPNENTPAPKVPTAPKTYMPPEEEFNEPSTGSMPVDDGEAAWTSLGQGGLNPQPPIERAWSPERQGEREALNPVFKTVDGFYDNQNSYALSDAVYEQTDTHGTKVNDPYLGRTSVRNLYGQLNPDNAPTWMDYQENKVTSKLALTATDVSSDQGEGTVGVGNGKLAPWGSIADSGGNTAYETPGPPATSSASASSLFSEGGWN